MLFFIASFIAASSFANSDKYGSPVPQSFEKDSIVFPTAGLQSMENCNISTADVLRLSRLNPNTDLIKSGSLNLLFDREKPKSRFVCCWRD